MGSKTSIIKPDLYQGGHILYITDAFPPASGGSSVINRNLLSYFNRKSYTVITSKIKIANKISLDYEVDVRRVISAAPPFHKLYHYWLTTQMPFVINKIISIAREKNAKAIMTTFPNYYLMKIAYEAAQKLNLPLIPYLHDTLSESLQSNTKLKNKAVQLQKKLFQNAPKIFVMSEGMTELYKKKYQIEAIPLEHTYLETINNTPPDITKKQENIAFWGGAVYQINANAIKRVAQALNQNNFTFYFASGTSPERLQNFGIDTSTIKLNFFKNRKDYLQQLAKSKVLVLALDDATESPVHADELATIFPTKTPEYLASGIPILVHCPKHYFLAKFFEKYQCGMVVSDTSIEALSSAINFLKQNNQTIKMYQQNALRVAHDIFSVKRIASKVQHTLNEVLAA